MTLGRSIVLAAALAVTGCSAEPAAISLIDLYPSAEKRAAFDLTQAFTVTDATVAGISRRVIVAHAPARLTWSVKVPKAATLRTWIALRPDAWERDGDGVVFRVGISAGDHYDVVARVHVDPRNKATDRAWLPLDVPLDKYAGQQVKVVLSTDASPSADRGDLRGDLALWGEPQIVGGPTRIP